MPRIRTLKPEFWADEKLGPCNPVTRLVFLGLISLADDAGRCLDSVKWLDGAIFPFTQDSCFESLRELATLGVIERGFTASGQGVIQLKGWNSHQKIEKPNFSAALPPIDASRTRETPIPRRVADESPMNRGGVADESPTHTYDLRPTTNDQKDSVRSSERTDTQLTGTQLAEFNEFWQAYPRKTAIAQARKAWKKILDRPPLDQLLAAVHAQVETEQWRSGVIPHAATWLHQRRWEDDVTAQPRASPRSGMHLPQSFRELDEKYGEVESD